MNNVVAIVVTYNRKKLLKENIETLLNQEGIESDIIVIDNASTDGTEDMIRNFNTKKIIYINTKKNLGGAGGFSLGVKKACELGYQYGWIMDDDSIPEKNSLRLLGEFAKNNEFSFLASTVYWTDGQIFPMNKPSQELIDDNTLSIVKKNRVLPISTCSFVGCFVKLEHVKSVGLPISEFFIYGDDMEYTRRLRLMAPAYWVLESEIIHKAPSNKGADVVTSPVDRIDRFYYQARNTIYLMRKEKGNKEKIIQLLKNFKLIYRIIRYSKGKKVKRIFVLLKGWFMGLFFNPQIKNINDSTI